VTSTFSELPLVEPLQRALRAQEYTKPTPIQAQAIPHLLTGRDLLGVAQTGTGKTAAFALPILQRLAENRVAAGPRATRCLVLTPTRELAIQIDESFRAYGRYMNLRQAVVFGGVGHKPQIDAMSRGVDILTATPGRLLDLMNQGFIRLDRLSVFVLDEADRMLDMGFIHDVRRIVAALPKQRQSLFFSATMPPDIARLAGTILTNPVKVEVTPVSSTVEIIDQRVLHVASSNKRGLLIEVLKDPAIARVLVFSRTKHGANRIAEQLASANVRADAIHGNKSQSARQRALENFKLGRVRVLVATDIAARGIDIDGITHVINYDLPDVPESYVHRIGRTARAGASGTALTFCDSAERGMLREIEKLTRRPLTVVPDHPFANVPGTSAPLPGPRGRQQQRGSGHRHQGGPQRHGQRQGERHGERHGAPHSDRRAEPQRRMA
jgi:ATP-dependent RNA helicase RhlE